MKPKSVAILVLLGIAFLNGIFMNSRFGSGYTISMWIWILCAGSIVVLLSYGKVSKRIKEKGVIKGILISMLIFIVLIPLVFVGTCILSLSAASFKGLFMPPRPRMIRPARTYHAGQNQVFQQTQRAALTESSGSKVGDNK